MIVIATFWSCSDSDHITLPSGVKSSAGEAGATTEGGAGTESSVSGGPTGSAGANSGPGAAGDPGQDSAAGTSAGASPEANGGANAGAGPSTGAGAAGATASGGTAAGGGAGGGSDAGEALGFCPRLTTPALSAFNVTRAYDHAVYADCRITWVTGLYLKDGARDTFLNNLLSWSLQFWGCQGTPVTDFALIYEAAPLTSADAAALIDTYIAAATAELTLSTVESNDMRAALLRLSKQTVATDSTDYSHSSCAAGSGGTAGSGGAASGGAGTGGSNP